MITSRPKHPLREYISLSHKVNTQQLNPPDFTHMHTHTQAHTRTPTHIHTRNSGEPYNRSMHTRRHTHTYPHIRAHTRSTQRIKPPFVHNNNYDLPPTSPHLPQLLPRVPQRSTFDHCFGCAPPQSPVLPIPRFRTHPDHAPPTIEFFVLCVFSPCLYPNF